MVFVLYHLLQRQQYRIGPCRKRIQASRTSQRLFVSPPLTYPWKNLPRKGVLVAWCAGWQTWRKVEAMNGSGCLTGIAIGMYGLAVAEEGEKSQGAYLVSRVRRYVRARASARIFGREMKGHTGWSLFLLATDGSLKAYAKECTFRIGRPARGLGKRGLMSKGSQSR